MSGHVGNLSPKQEATLAEFKENVKDITRPHFDDHYFLRWLRARNFDLKKSEVMLRNNMKWREQNKVDTMLEWFEPPEVMLKYYTGGLFGQDKEGALIWIDPNGYIDIKGILMSMRKQEVILSKVYLLEKIYAMFEEKTKEQGRRVDQMVIIFDMEKFGLKHLWKPGVDVFTQIIAVFEDNYPETLKKTFVVNAPKIFPLAYSLLKPFLSEETHRKVTVCGSNYKEVLLQHIDADQLPAHWGGTCTDPDGNPRCPSLIIPGGQVPESYHRQNDLDDVSAFTQVSIGRGSTLKLEYVVDKPRCAIRWQFKTDGFDIGFGVLKKTADGPQKSAEMEEVVATQRVNSHMVPEDGMVQCKEAGTYVVRFDNTYSWARAKKLLYLIEVLQPQTFDLDMPKVDSSSSLASSPGDDVYKSF
ncbi:SEC14-like protein 2 [Aplysia californica]|uniref:SEC14-like protein 2 n=1 Tax=Aplysia californica TaxID=6500 RepID=A0ABM1A3M8_APLCA|nr:SEC14-like protein 2 [Aplysia californica]